MPVRSGSFVPRRGNQVAVEADYPGMRRDPAGQCNGVRLALSARLDDEGPTMPADRVDAHLDRCPACRAWLIHAARVNHTVRLQSVEAPDLTTRILAAAQLDGALGDQRTPATRPLLRTGLRWALGLLAVVQLMLAVPDLLGAVGQHAHVGREVAAFGIALAVGLLLTACYPEHARAFAPVVLTLVICLASASALDVPQGIVDPGRMALHGVAVLQAALTWWLAHAGSQRPITV
jgi:predicted anti-sigma-YlaC factor YlaD